MIIYFYLFYVVFSVGFTYWVGKNLHRNGRIFFVDSFQKDETKADAVNQLLLVGFYLVNFGLVFLFLSTGAKPTTPVEAFEFLAHK